MSNAAQVSPDLRYARSVPDAAEGAHLVMHLTEWAEYRALDPVLLGGIVAQRTIVDARCALDARLWRAAGWTLRAPGQSQSTNGYLAGPLVNKEVG